MTSAAAILGAIEADGVAAKGWVHVGKYPPNVSCPHPAVAAAEHCRAGRKKGRRMSERREQSERSEFGGPRPDRNAQGTGLEAAPAAVGPAASPGSVSWLLLGAPRSDSLKPAKPAAKRPLTLNLQHCRVGTSRPSRPCNNPQPGRPAVTFWEDASPPASSPAPPASGWRARSACSRRIRDGPTAARDAARSAPGDDCGRCRRPCAVPGCPRA